MVTVPPVRFIVPAPPTVIPPFAVIALVAEPDIVPFTVRRSVRVIVPVPGVNTAPVAMVVVPVTFMFGLFAVAVAPALVLSPIVRFPATVRAPGVVS